MVFFLHYGGGAQSSNPFLHAFGETIKFGWMGVTLFFVLSGFLITGILWDTRGSAYWWRNFYMRRCLRIFPLYYGALLLVLIGAAVWGSLGTALRNIWVYVPYLQNIPGLMKYTDSLGSPLWLYHFWSLAVEEQFYLIWPFLLVRAKNLNQAKILCLSVFLFSLGFRMVSWWASTPHNIWVESLPARCGELAVGAYLAMCFRQPATWRRIQRWAPAVAIASFAAMAVIRIFTRTPLMTWRLSVLGLACGAIGFGAVLAAATTSGWVNKVMCFGWLRNIGKISYGIYVYHVLLIIPIGWAAHRLSFNLGRNVELGLNFIIGAVVSYIVASLSYRFFELPFLKMRSRYQTESVAMEKIAA